MLTRKDVNDITTALRETAKGLQTVAITEGVKLEFMQALGIELLVLALKHGPLLDEINRDADEAQKAAREEALEFLIRRELAAITDTVASMHEHRIREIDVIHERLMRVFDPGPAFNEAVQRAIEAKKAKGEAAVMMTGTQKWMFDKFQVPSMMNALFNAGHPEPVPMVHKVNNADVTAMHKALEGDKAGK